MNINFDFSGKRVLITGSTGGIGASICRLFSKAQAEVIMTGTSQEKLEQLQATLPYQGQAIKADLTQGEHIAKLLQEAGRVDILINNAGITRDQIALRMSDEEWDTVLATNLTIPFKLCQHFLKGMRQAGWGRIINITSIVGVMGNVGQANYSAAKAGLIGLTKTLAREYAAKDIRINCVAPGFISTPMTDKIKPEYRQKMLENIAVNSFGTPEEVAYTVAFLATQEANYITGQTIHVNGGMLMP